MRLIPSSSLVLLILAPTCLATFAERVAPTEDPSGDHETTRVADGIYTFRWKQHRDMFVVIDEGPRHGSVRGGRRRGPDAGDPPGDGPAGALRRP